MAGCGDRVGLELDTDHDTLVERRSSLASSWSRVARRSSRPYLPRASKRSRSLTRLSGRLNAAWMRARRSSVGPSVQHQLSGQLLDRRSFCVQRDRCPAARWSRPTAPPASGAAGPGCGRRRGGARRCGRRPARRERRSSPGGWASPRASSSGAPWRIRSASTSNTVISSTQHEAQPRRHWSRSACRSSSRRASRSTPACKRRRASSDRLGALMSSSKGAEKLASRAGTGRL